MEPCFLVLLYLVVEAVNSDCKEELQSFSGDMLMVWVTSESTFRLLLLGVRWTGLSTWNTEPKPSEISTNKALQHWNVLVIIFKSTY